MKKEIRHLAMVEIQRIARSFISRRKVRRIRGLRETTLSFSTMMSNSDLVIRDLEEEGNTFPENVQENTDQCIPMDISSSITPPSLLPPQPAVSGNVTNTDVLSLSGSVDIFHSGRRGGSNSSSPAHSRPLTPAVSSSGSSVGLVTSTAINSTFVLPGSNQDSAHLYSRYKELLAEKRELKRTLKRFDEDFATKQGRLPVKSEKEVMRPMYQKYHEIKHDMDALRTTIESRHGPMPSDDEQDAAMGFGDGIRDRSLSDSTDKLFDEVRDSQDLSKYKKLQKNNSGTLNNATLSALLASPPPRSSIPLNLSGLR